MLLHGADDGDRLAVSLGVILPSRRLHLRLLAWPSTQSTIPIPNHPLLRGVQVILIFPALDVLSAYPLNAITLGNNLLSATYGNQQGSVHEHGDGHAHEGDGSSSSSSRGSGSACGCLRLSPTARRRIAFRLIAAVPPVAAGAASTYAGLNLTQVRTIGLRLRCTCPAWVLFTRGSNPRRGLIRSRHPVSPDRIVTLFIITNLPLLTHSHPLPVLLPAVAASDPVLHRPHRRRHCVRHPLPAACLGLHAPQGRATGRGRRDRRALARRKARQ